MFSNQALEVRLTAGLVVVAVLAAGCSSFGSRNRGSADATQAPIMVPEPEETLEEPEEMTATEAAIAKGDAGVARAEPMPSDAGADSIINPNAPRTYTVKRGDTLWDISTLFLRDPWLWPEIWYVNPQVANPHLIYPGDVLALAYGADGRPQIRLERGGPARLDPRLRSTPLDGAIPTIPYSAIAAFLSRPSILSNEQIKGAPHVLALRDGHMIAGAGHEVYVRNLDAPQNARYSVMHIGEPLRDPDDGHILGYEGIYAATAVVTNPGAPAKAALSESDRETREGDRLFSTDVEVPLNIIPRAPRNNVEGRIISVVDGVELIGQFQIVAINRGKRHGVDVGHVLAVDQAGEIVRDTYSNKGRFGLSGDAFAEKVQLPNERAGTLLIFRSFDRMSYGLVIGASNAIRIADVVRSP